MNSFLICPAAVREDQEACNQLPRTPAGIGWDHSGQLLLVNGGSLVDPEKVAYMHLDVSTLPISKPGFVMLQSGVPTLFGNPPMTNWEYWI